MVSGNPPPPTPATNRPGDRLVGIVLFLLFVAGIFTYPNKPALELDASWRMALAQFLHDGLQFGRDVVFTYGPLGFLMGKTYFGLYFWPLALWQLCSSVAFATLIFVQGRGTTGYARVGYFVFFLFFGIIYEDALHMLMIALMGFMLLRHSDGEYHKTDILLALFLAFLGVIKFTNLLLAAFAIGVVAAHELWRRRPIAAVRLPLWFGGAFLTYWVLCGQSLLNLPAYFINSWEVSQGYQAVMGLPTPPGALWKGLAVLGLLITYVGIYLWTHSDRPRALAHSALLAALLFLNWKHGFVRADGHMIGFYICAFLPIVAFPRLMEDAPRFHRLKRGLLVATGVLCLISLEYALEGVVRGALGGMQEKIWSNIYKTTHWSAFRQGYRDRLNIETIGADLHKTREVVGQASIDVLGHDVAVAIFNRFNYHPRPVFQSYSAYTPRLAALNYDFYAGPNAPAFVLLRFQTIDGRLTTFDDSRIYPLLVHRYTFVHTEGGFQLWRRKPGAFDDAAAAPHPVRTQTLTLNQPVSVEDLVQQHVWAVVDVRLSLLGRLRAFFYKPPVMSLVVEDVRNSRFTFRLPLPQGRTGFILNPLVEDVVNYMQFAGDNPDRLIRRITAQVPPEDLKYFDLTGQLELSTLKPSSAGLEYFAQSEKARFHMFKSFPIANESRTPPSEGEIDKQPVVVMHAPSEMVFNAPEGTKNISGRFGFLVGTYSNGGHTNGADFRVSWSNGGERIELYRRTLDPARLEEDRGLHFFSVEVPASPGGGRLYLQVLPGPYNDYSWDWTAWTGIEIK